jgi:hypothetical protein
MKLSNHKLFKNLLRLILASFLLVACQKETESPAPLTATEQYNNAIKDAMVAEPNEVSTNLVSITESNKNLIWQTNASGEKRVLMVSWTKFISSYPVGDTVQTRWGHTWVTSAPEMKNWFKLNYPTNLTIEQRAEQLLGIPFGQGYTHFVEIWVKPEDLFRPAPDKEITDSKAELDFPANTDDIHRRWINENIIFSYYPQKYPWTRLGYTYDWGNSKSEIGLSEFILNKNAKVIVKAVTPNASYLTR